MCFVGKTSVAEGVGVVSEPDRDSCELSIGVAHAVEDDGVDA